MANEAQKSKSEEYHRHFLSKVAEMESNLRRLTLEHEAMMEGTFSRGLQTQLVFFDPEAREAGLPALFGRIQEELRGSDFNDLFNRWTRRLPTETGRGGITVIPGNSDSPICTPLVVVFVLSGLSRMGIDGGYSKSAIAELKLHLETCRAVRGVLLVFAWDAVLEFDDELRRWIRAWKSRDIAFAIGVCGPDNKCIQPYPTGA